MNKTVFYDRHVKLGGRIVDFAGWQLPVMYSSIIEEHIATRENAGLFDISHMGEILIKGESAGEFLKKLIPTRLDKLTAGKSMYSCLCNEKGGIIDDLFIFMISDKEYYIVVNAANIEKDFNWFLNHKINGVEIINLSDDTSKIDLQGPKSKDILLKVFSDNSLKELKRFYFAYVEYKNKKVMISNTGYTGEKGYEIYMPNDLACLVWDELLEAGREFGIKPAGLGARDTLRVEACYSLYGHELKDDVTPVESGIGWLVSSDSDYIAKSILVKQKEKGAQREVVAVELTGRGIPREGCRIIKDGNDIGHVTSGVYSPLFKKGIALAIVKSGFVNIDDNIEVLIRDKKVDAKIVKRPFYVYNA